METTELKIKILKLPQMEYTKQKKTWIVLAQERSEEKCRMNRKQSRSSLHRWAGIVILYCLCLKRETLRNCLSSSSFLRHFSGITGRLNYEFGAKRYFTDHWTANLIPLFVVITGNFFCSILFVNKSQGRAIRQTLLDKCSYLFICIALKYTLSNIQNPVWIVKILLPEQIALAAMFLPWVSFCFLKERVGMVYANSI